MLALLGLATLARARPSSPSTRSIRSAHRTQWLGLTLGLALAALAAALFVLAQRLVVTEELEEPYPDPDLRGRAGRSARSSPRAAAASRAAALLALGGLAAAGTLGLALLAPLLSLGPSFRRARSSGRRGGVAAGSSTRTAAPLAAADDRGGQLLHRVPEGAGREQLGAPLVLVRLPELDLPDGRREGWAPGGIVAYSKICTHAGCAVVLYRKPTFPEAQPKPALVCPCHYSTFDPATGGTVLVGPAGRPLPQLPLELDEAGDLRAAGDF